MWERGTDLVWALKIYEMKWIAVSLESNTRNEIPHLKKEHSNGKITILNRRYSFKWFYFFRCHVFQACKTRKRIQQQTEHGLEPVRENKNTSPWSRGFKGYNEANYLRTIQHISLLLNVDMTKKHVSNTCKPPKLFQCTRRNQCSNDMTIPWVKELPCAFKSKRVGDAKTYIPMGRQM